MLNPSEPSTDGGEPFSHPYFEVLDVWEEPFQELLEVFQRDV